MTEREKQFMESYLMERRTARQSTKKAVFSLRIFFDYLGRADIDVSRLTIFQAQEFQLYLTTLTTEDGAQYYARGSILAIIDGVSMFYEYLKRKREVYTNPFRGIERIRGKRRLPRSILNEQDMDTLLQHLKDFNRGRNLLEKKQLYKAHVIAEVMYSTGARIHEVVTLRMEDIDFTHGTVHLTDSKTKKRRQGILNSFAGEVLQVYCATMREQILTGNNRDTMDFLFGSQYHVKQWLNVILSRTCETLGLERTTSHAIRHGVGYHLLRGGCDIRYIQEILGHASLRSTQIYTRVDKEDLKSVIDRYHPRILKSGKREKAS